MARTLEDLYREASELSESERDDRQTCWSTIRGRRERRMQLVELPVQYLQTLVDFVFFKRPKRFFQAVNDDPTRYIHPLGFLVTNLALAATLAFAVAKSLPPPPGEEALSQLTATAMVVAIALVHCVITVLLGKLAGFLLNEVTTGATLFYAFCYSSVFYIGIASLLPFLLDEAALQFRLRVSFALTAIQLVATAYLLLSMAHASGLHGRRLLAFVSLCGSAIAIVMSILTIAVMAALSSEHEHYAFTLCSGAGQWPTAAVTLPAQGRNASVVVLMGASLGSKTGESFDFGRTLAMTNSVRATDGVGYARELKPGTKYYFRYVTQHGDARCFGHMLSFTTDAL